MSKHIHSSSVRIHECFYSSHTIKLVDEQWKGMCVYTGDDMVELRKFPSWTNYVIHFYFRGAQWIMVCLCPILTLINEKHSKEHDICISIHFPLSFMTDKSSKALFSSNTFYSTILILHLKWNDWKINVLKNKFLNDFGWAVQKGKRKSVSFIGVFILNNIYEWRENIKIDNHFYGMLH